MPLVVLFRLSPACTYPAALVAVVVPLRDLISTESSRYLMSGVKQGLNKDPKQVSLYHRI